MVSVVTCTAKPHPNLNFMVDCLKSQIYSDFEWVIIDRLLMDRPAGLYEEIRSACEFDVIVKPPLPSIYHEFNLPDISNARNTGILNSSRDIILWYDDNMWIAPDHISKHMKMHGVSDLVYALGLFWPFYDWGGVAEFSEKEPFDGEGNFCRVGSFEDNNSNLQHGIRPDDCRAYMSFPLDTPTYSFPPYEVVKGSWCYNGNLSFPVKLAEKLNGYDQHLDGSFGGEDVNFGVRADNAGAIGLLDRSCCAYDYRGESNDSIINLMPSQWNHIGEINGNKLTRREFDMIAIQRGSRYRENAYFSLAEERERTLKERNI